eukprot:CAMPEP_0182905858 /NCGR_PEP_ID=MMETSP0034_2-20130328/33276_1 /TAXON_ID=156128 /ORGANISM="Nephroselmis pyriformis, Strain CCMP717" /LENGTH=230 /DNA_ID=CAMNT_0025041369 /DNA_START=83 /DNA_END=771 /DNA_ORIENTATION=+
MGGEMRDRGARSGSRNVMWQVALSGLLIAMLLKPTGSSPEQPRVLKVVPGEARGGERVAVDVYVLGEAFLREQGRWSCSFGDSPWELSMDVVSTREDGITVVRCVPPLPYPSLAAGSVGVRVKRGTGAYGIAAGGLFTYTAAHPLGKIVPSLEQAALRGPLDLLRGTLTGQVAGHGRAPLTSSRKILEDVGEIGGGLLFYGVEDLSGAEFYGTVILMDLEEPLQQPLSAT